MSNSKEPLSPKERLNRNMMVGCNILGALFAIVALIIEIKYGNGSLNLLKDGPVTPITAILFACLFGLILPVIAIFWHRNAIDEQEEAAYKDGAYYAAYAFITLAPVWWILAKAQLVPEPSGIAIYTGFLIIWAFIWFKKKYS